MWRRRDPLSVDDHSPPPKLGLEAAIAGLRMLLKHGFDLSIERVVRSNPSPFGLFSLLPDIPS
ncbi:MAG: hypothetical protein IMX04_08315 [Candidatus Carbobacillus altaicus]|nr:hypothetical protein [Candidatus Carbobacillus altaicus]